MAAQKPFLKFFKSESTALLLFTALIGLWGMFLFEYLYSYREPSGIDGYFYLKQIRVLATSGEFYFKDYSFGFLLPYLIYKIKPNELLAYQFSMAIYSMLLAYALILVGRCFWTKQESPWWRWVIGIAALGSLFFNHSFYEFSLTYLKNLAGLCFFSFGFYFLLKDQIHRDKRPSRKQVEPSILPTPLQYTILWVLFFMLALLSHKSMFIFIGIALVSLHSLKKKQIWLLAALALFSVVLFGVLFTTGWQYLDFLRQQVQEPQEFLIWIKYLVKVKNYVFFGLFFGLFSLIGVIFERRKWQRRVFIFLFLLFTFSWFPYFLQNIEAPNYRLMLMHFSIAPILLVQLISTRKWLLPLSGIALGLIAYQWLNNRSLGIYFKNYSAMGGDVKRLEKFVNVGDHLTCHHGLEFYVDYNTIIRCRSFVSDDREQEKLRLVYVFHSWPDAAKKRIKKEAFMHLGENYSLMTEVDWKVVRARYKLPDSWRNPMEQRPAYISF